MIIVFHLGVWSPYPINVAHYLLDNLHFSIEEKDPNRGSDVGHNASILFIYLFIRFV